MQIAIGDIHGCLTSLQTLFEAIQPKQEDLIVTLGDYVDRGIDSKGVIEYLLLFKSTHHLIHLMGNHEIQMLRALEAPQQKERFLSELCGGQETLKSYGGHFRDIPEEHWEFIRSAELYHELDDHILVHAGLDAALPVDQQNQETYYYQRFYEQGPHISGKIVVCGHTIQGDLPARLPHAICLDTCAYGGGWLTALDLLSGQIWQANENGKVRTLHLEDIPLP